MARTSGALRTAACRIRQATGHRLLSIEVTEAELDMLRVMGLLTSDGLRAEPAAVERLIEILAAVLQDRGDER